jgi:histidinol dehydrogenase
MALGTESVPRVDLIAGPGNVYVTEAKRQLTAVVAVDLPAGPSELLVIADEGADPAIVAREMLAQAEHDPFACVVTLVVGSGRDEAIVRELGRRLRGSARHATIVQALARTGAVLRAASIREAIAFASEFAPEHLLLAVQEPESVLPLVRNAGTVFLGVESSVTFGDYMTGANHVLPTAGRARTFDGLTTGDFFRWTTYQRVTRAAARSLAPDVTRLAVLEGLEAHARAASAWEAPQ